MTTPARTIIRGGTVYLEDGPQPADIFLEGERVAAIAPHLADVATASTIDAHGLSVLPGMIDFHVHLDDRIGEQELADSYLSGSHAAILTGVTTLVSFVTQSPTSSLRKCIEIAAVKVRKGSFCDIHFHLTPTTFSKSDWSEIDQLIQRGYRTFKFYTTYKEAGLYQSYESLLEIMKKLAARKARILIHCEDQDVLDQARDASFDFADAFTHARLRPPAAETTAIQKLLELVEQSGAELHVVHVSTDEGAALLSKAKQRLPVTFETAPHYLFLNEGQLKGTNGHRFICSPPLRDARTQSRLCDAAASGAFDIFATDHCTFLRSDKDRHRKDVRKVPNGLAGIGALVPLTYQFFAERQEKPLEQLAMRLAKNPARLSGVYPRKGALRVGADADVVILAENGNARPIRASLSNCYDSYESRMTGLDFRFVFQRGKLAVKDNTLADPNSPTGQVVYPL